MKNNRREYKSSMERALENPRLKKQYLSELERLFDGSRLDPEQEKEIQKLHKAHGTDRFAKMARSYIKRYGLPKDKDTLMLLLDLEHDTKIVIEAMEGLVKLASELPTHEARGIKSKLRIIGMTSKDADIAEMAETLVEEL